jgi:hypothetical protein
MGFTAPHFAIKGDLRLPAISRGMIRKKWPAVFFKKDHAQTKRKKRADDSKKRHRASCVLETEVRKT